MFLCKIITELGAVAQLGERVVRNDEVGGSNPPAPPIQYTSSGKKMVQITNNTQVDFVLEQIEKLVASEGGTLDSVSLDGNNLKVKYTPGVNEECPECVPTHDMVNQFLTASLSIHAPHVDNIEVS